MVKGLSTRQGLQASAIFSHAAVKRCPCLEKRNPGSAIFCPGRDILSHAAVKRCPCLEKRNPGSAIFCPGRDILSHAAVKRCPCLEKRNPGGAIFLFRPGYLFACRCTY